MKSRIAHSVAVILVVTFIFILATRGGDVIPISQIATPTQVAIKEIEQTDEFKVQAAKTELFDDVRVAPEPSIAFFSAIVSAEQRKKMLQDASIGEIPSQSRATIFGDKVVNVIMVESNCSGCALNWSSSQVLSTQAEIQSGLLWWRDQIAIRTGVGYNYLLNQKFVEVAFEPTQHPSIALNWIEAAIDQQIAQTQPQAGLDVDLSSLNVFDKVRYYNYLTASLFNVEHGFTLFVVQGTQFTDGWFAFAYLGGPFGVVTYNNANWGPENQHLVSAHEFGHLLYSTLDQYSSASCTGRSGYLEKTVAAFATVNLDAQTLGGGCRVPPQPGVMAMTAGFWENGHISDSTWAQGGWADVLTNENGQIVFGSDGYPDPLVPHFEWTDLGGRVEDIEADILVTPVTGAVALNKPLVTKVYLLADGMEIELSQGGIAPISAGSVEDLADIEELKICMNIAGWPKYCESIRAAEKIEIFLPIVVRNR